MSNYEVVSTVFQFGMFLLTFLSLIVLILKGQKK